MQFADIKNNIVFRKIFGNENKTEILISFLNDEGLKSAYTEADRHTWTKADLEAYEYAQMRETDEKAEKLLVERKAKIEIAQNFITLGLDNNTIAKGIGLTVEQIEELRNETKEN
jgi:hypothetical protein